MMIPLDQWKSFLKTTQLTTGSFGIILNVFLILLIIFRSPKHLGAYKYLMIYISIVEIVYSILEMITEPHVFTNGPTLTVLRYFKHSRIGRNQGFYLLVMYAGTFGQSIALFGVHFIYRYGAVDNVFRKKYLGERKLFILFLIPLIYALWWSSIIFFFFQPSTESDEYLRIPLLQNYDTKVEDISYLIVFFYKPNEIGYLEPTLIPVVLMYVPAGVVYSLPMLNIEAGLSTSFVIVTIAIYPAVDPLPTMFIVENFRKTILCGCWEDRKPKSESQNRSQTIH